MSDNWGFYFRLVDGKPASIAVDLGIAPEAPVAARPTLAYVRLHMRQPRPDGLSSQEEFDALIQIEDVLLAAVGDAAIYVGRNTTDGLRDLYFYTGAQDWQARALATIGRFPKYRFETGQRDDTAWRVYFDFLHPTPRERQSIENRRVLATLEKAGDALTQPREIEHWAYFKTATARDAFVARASERGFLIVSTRNDTTGSQPFGAQIARSGVPSYQEIDDITLPLFDLAQELGGAYDGWETRVVR